jgi:hypothetical protein
MPNFKFKERYNTFSRAFLSEVLSEEELTKLDRAQNAGKAKYVERRAKAAIEALNQSI